MVKETENEKIKALPLQIIEVEGGVIVKRSCTEFKVSGSGVKELINWIVEVASGPEGVNRQDLINAFAGTDREVIENLILQLEARNLMVSANAPLANVATDPVAAETKENIFYWNFGKTETVIAKSLSSQNLVILGVNYITQHLTNMLVQAGCKKLKVIDAPNFRNLDFFTESGDLKPDKWLNAITPAVFDIQQIDDMRIDCLIAASDFGGMHGMREWNKLSVERGTHFLPIVLQNLVGYIGPHVIPGETPCYECARARQNSNMENIDDERATEKLAFEGQSAIGFHPSMATMLADLAHLEISKFYGGWSNSSSIGKIIQVHMLTPSVSSKKLLKVPRCIVCSPMKSTASMVVQKDFYMPGNAE